MNLLDSSDIRKTLKAFGVHINKDLGQHFLTDEKALETIVESADVSKKDRVVEIGPDIKHNRFSRLSDMG